MVEVFTIIGGIGEVQIAGNEQVTKGFQIIAKLQASCRRKVAVASCHRRVVVASCHRKVVVASCHRKVVVASCHRKVVVASCPRIIKKRDRISLPFTHASYHDFEYT